MQPRLNGFSGSCVMLASNPIQVITDGSSLYPTVLAKIWPTAAHQLCLFHETRHVTRAVLDVILGGK